MLVIRDGRPAAFPDSTAQRFGGHMLADSADSFPGDFQRLGQAGLLAVARQGLPASGEDTSV